MTNIASPLHRFLAFLLDCLFSFALILFPLLMLLSSSNSLTDLFDHLGLFIAALIFGGSAITLLQIYLTAAFGGSLGKLLLGVQVVNPSGHHISFWRAAFRCYIGYLVSGVFLWTGYVWILVDKKSRRAWHDLVADTFVTVSHPNGLLTGLVALVLLVLASWWSISQSISQFSQNKYLYQTLFSEISAGLNKS